MTEYEDEEYDVYKIEKVRRKKKPKKRLPDLVPKKWTPAFSVENGELGSSKRNNAFS